MEGEGGQSGRGPARLRIGPRGCGGASWPLSAEGGLAPTMMMKAGLLVVGWTGTEAAGSEAEGQAEAKRPAASVCDMWQAVTWFETPRLDSSRLAEGGSNGVTRRARALRDTSRWNG